MRSLTEPLHASEQYNIIVQALSAPQGRILASGCTSSQKLHLIYALTRENALMSSARFRVIVTYSEKRAREIQQEYLFYDRSTSVFPAKDLIFYQADLRGREIETERLKSLRRIMEGRPATIVTTFAALETPQVPLRVLRKSIVSIEKGGTVSEEELAESLVGMGYEKTGQVDSPGQFSVRGGIIDIFDLTEENPYRIELFDDEVESLRSFDVRSQRSIEEMDAVRIYPASEMILTPARLQDGAERIQKELKKTAAAFRKNGEMEAAHRLEEEISSMLEAALEFHDYGRLESCIHYCYPETESFLDLFPPENTMVFLDEPARVHEEASAVETEFRESMISRAQKGYALPGQMDILSGEEHICAVLSRYRCAGLSGLITKSPYFDDSQAVLLHVQSIAPYNKSMDALLSDLRRYRKEHYKVIIISASRTRAKRLAQDLTAQGLTAFYSENPDRVLEPSEIMTYYGHISQGFSYPDLQFSVIAETDIFGAEAKPKKKKKRPEGETIASLSDLKVGDYVVHEDHGIGIYRGVEKIELDGTFRDYLKIEYGGGDILYVLPTELNVLQKYASAKAAKPKLNKLGTAEWSNTKNKVKGAVEEVAQDLVELYAKRQAQKGHVFSADTVWQKEFEEMFPYEETPDQLTAIEDTKRDMESTKIMDRLICGDVGYGKTEIAIRAAFKAVQDGYQVAVLVPTTILAQQHFNTFTERMKEFPVNIEMLSRFRTSSEIKKALEKIRTGQADIVIGTHRLLSKDVQFRNLGLLVVDEEQRFGVTHKEKIKKMKENVDVLTLSATPIPRTLHMSLVGIRDMSVLEEAPQERVPIQTYVMEYNEELVREAILRELSRGGQVYYVYNRVNDIAEVTARLQQQVPEARIAYAHGQMTETELEKIMYDFVSGEIDVLVSTTIIETGLDISNVNTIIVHDADRMGLAQLYQLRGRVGRSNRRAYAYLMYKKDKVLKEEAEKRLAAIREFTDLGSGFRIAMRDLEIRGAGSVLGRAQHGHMAAVGYDLYCKLLEMAVKKAKGEPVQEERSVRVSLSVDAFIPESYIVNEEQKLDIYKRISAISGTADADEMKDELIDRFGSPIPAAAQNLLRIALIRAVAARLDLVDITGGPDTAQTGTIRYTMARDAKVRVENLPKLLAHYRPALAFFPKGMPKGELKGLPYWEYTYRLTGVTVRDEETLLGTVENFLVDMENTIR